MFQVKLEEMPSQFKEALEEYNIRAVDVFGLYLRTLGNKIKAEHGEENRLPLSRVGKSLKIKERTSSFCSR